MKTTPSLFVIAAIFAVEKSVFINAFREFDVDGQRTILSLGNETINIQCKYNKPMDYCRFVDPVGKRYSISGSSLINGRCNLKIKVSETITGEWECYIGKKAGVEAKQKMMVRIVGQLAAVQPNMTALSGDEVTLLCATIKTLTPLSYCRFEPPSGVPFSISSNVKKSDAILYKYYFPQNMSLDRGDCAVTIRKVQFQDVGTWTCAAGLNDDKEYYDVINVEVKGMYTMSTASFTGVIYGTVAVVVLLVILGIVSWRKRRILFGRQPPAAEEREMETVANPSCSQQRTPSPNRKRHKAPVVVVQSPSDTSSPSD